MRRPEADKEPFTSAATVETMTLEAPDGTVYEIRGDVLRMVNPPQPLSEPDRKEQPDIWQRWIGLV